MNRITRTLLLPALFTALAVAAGTSHAQTTSPQDALKAATERMNAIKAATGAKPSAQKVPPGDPCAALTQASVQSLFPGAKAGERTNRLNDFSINECQWKNDAGVVLLILRDSFDSGTSAKEDAIGMADVYTGMKGKAKNVRIETFSSLGVDNAGFAEPRDATRGIPNDYAFLQLRKGQHDIELSAPGLAGRDRSQVLKALETLGRQAATRL